ncbi:Hypothetical predicted protein [Cloeon dipterum]|uniref:Cell cycle checkpoint control protein n=1 Tax=Cloeon dipterum TaxID=197152 RepID=A0A8S1CUI5_9INSE|nr:Hypothetical predicted protein [Cloeon dipterum]
MKCHIPSANVKVLAKAIQTLSRIGDELYIQPHADGIYFRTVDAQRSAFATFDFHRSFFLHYSSSSNQASSSQSQAQPEICKVAMKSCLSVFRTQNINVEMCKLFFSNNGRMLVFQLVCRHSICKTHHVPVIQTETLQANYNKSTARNKLLTQSKLLIDALQNFSNNQDEITISVAASKMILRNFTETGEFMKNTVRTEFALESTEFDSLQIGVDATVTFNLKELRALLSFAEVCSLPVSGHFDNTPGRPIIFCVNNQPAFDAEIVLATMSSNDTSTFSQSQSTISQRSVNESALRKRPSTSIDPSQSTQKRPTPATPSTPQQPVLSQPPITPQIHTEIEEIQQLHWEDDEEEDSTDSMNTTQTDAVVLAYDSDGESGK